MYHERHQNLQGEITPRLPLADETSSGDLRTLSFSTPRTATTEDLASPARATRSTASAPTTSTHAAADAGSEPARPSAKTGVVTWLKNAFRAEWPTMPIYCLGVLTCIPVTAWASSAMDAAHVSKTLLSGLATAIDLGSFYAVFLTGLAIKERKDFLDENGHWSARCAREKGKEFLKLFGAMELVYLSLRTALHYGLMKLGMDAGTSAALTQGALAVLFVVGVPIFRYWMKQRKMERER